jgi:hypothetical protein
MISPLTISVVAREENTFSPHRMRKNTWVNFNLFAGFSTSSLECLPSCKPGQSFRLELRTVPSGLLCIADDAIE